VNADGSLNLKPSWMLRGACVGVAREVMFEEQSIDDAKRLCALCPVRAECLAYAVEHEIEYGVWGLTTWEERTRICPICMGPKDPEALGCNFPHTLLMTARLVELEHAGNEDVRVARRGKPSMRTDPECPLERGQIHNSPAAYREGCKCAASREALRQYRLEKQADRKSRGTYRKRAS